MTAVVRTFAVSMLLAGCGAVALGAGARSDAARDRKLLVGSYKLVSYINYDRNGGQTPSPLSIGQISYDAAGRMSAQLMRDSRPRFTSTPPSDADRAAAFSSYVSYFGHYDIDADKKTVTHHVEGSMSPNGVGGNLVRHYEFSPDGKSLFLSVKDADGRVLGRLQWDRYR